MLPPYTLFFRHFRMELDLWFGAPNTRDPFHDYGEKFSVVMEMFQNQIRQALQKPAPQEVDCFRLILYYNSYKHVIEKEAPDLAAALDGVVEAHRIRERAYEDACNAQRQQKEAAETEHPVRDYISAVEKTLQAPDEDDLTPPVTSNKPQTSTDVINADPEDEEEEEVEEEEEKAKEPEPAQKRVREENVRLIDEDEDEVIEFPRNKRVSCVITDQFEEEELEDYGDEEEEEDENTIEVPLCFQCHCSTPSSPTPATQPSTPPKAPNAPHAYRKKIILWVVKKKAHH